MAIFPVFDTASSALTTNRIWMDAIADNLANVNTIRPFDQPAFQARFIEAQELPANPAIRSASAAASRRRRCSTATRRRSSTPIRATRSPTSRASCARPTSTSPSR